jgi:hypothetical protein
MEFLSEIEKEKITAFLKDPILVEAVRKVFLKRIYFDGVLQPDNKAVPYENFALNVYKSNDGAMYSDEELGKLTKLRRLAIELVQSGFESLENYKKVGIIKESKLNKAR